MHILFVSSGNKFGSLPTPLVEYQGESLKKNGVDITYFLVKGKGWKGYFKNIFLLRKYLNRHNFDLIHAHFVYSGIVVSLSTRKPVIVSLMGSDLYRSFFWRNIAKLFMKFFWNETIVKTRKMIDDNNLPEALIIPNGVDFSLFRPIDKDIARKKVNFTKNKNILFVANDLTRREKNFRLAKKVFDLIKKDEIALKTVSFLPKKILVYYYNAADILLLTSLYEGSANVIKEAMACNLPIVSTDVGDIKDIIGSTEGCYITSFNPEDVAQKIIKALEFGNRTSGREKIKHLDSNIIAKKIIAVYQNVLNN